jgi:hypothetical protein
VNYTTGISLELTLSSVCQLHGGDIGVSSKEGEGSTFGFFFKVRRSDDQSEDGRPSFQSRSSSESSQTGSREPMLQARPGYQRANSNLTQIKERPNERPVVKTLTSHNGVNIEKADVDDSLQNPPTEYLRESHPAAQQRIIGLKRPRRLLEMCRRSRLGLRSSLKTIYPA